MNLVVAISAVYVVTLLITNGSIFEPARRYLTSTFKWMTPHAGALPFLYCRMCVGFWVSLFCAWYFDCNFFIIYGASYMLAKQER